MKKFLSLFLAFLLLVSMSISALAEEAGIDSDSSSDVAPSAPAESPAPTPASDPDSSPSPAPSLVSPDPEPDTSPSQDVGSDIGQDPAPAFSETPAESGDDNASVQVPTLDVADPGLSSVAGDPGELPFDVTTAPNGDVIIEEHSYTRTVDIQDVSALDDLPTMRSVVVSIFGVYTPKTQSVATYYDGQLMDSSTEYVPGIAGMDMEWIAGFVIFTVLLYCLMKLLGGIVK